MSHRPSPHWRCGWGAEGLCHGRLPVSRNAHAGKAALASSPVSSLQGGARVLIFKMEKPSLRGEESHSRSRISFLAKRILKPIFSPLHRIAPPGKNSQAGNLNVTVKNRGNHGPQAKQWPRNGNDWLLSPGRCPGMPSLKLELKMLCDGQSPGCADAVASS